MAVYMYMCVVWAYGCLHVHVCGMGIWLSKCMWYDGSVYMCVVVAYGCLHVCGMGIWLSRAVYMCVCMWCVYGVVMCTCDMIQTVYQ